MSFESSYKKGYEQGSKGFPFLWLLGLLFIGLKLTGYISWAWYLVLLPFYGPLLLVLAFCAILLLIAGVVAIFA